MGGETGSHAGDFAEDACITKAGVSTEADHAPGREVGQGERQTDFQDGSGHWRRISPFHSRLSNKVEKGKTTKRKYTQGVTTSCVSFSKDKDRVSYRPHNVRSQSTPESAHVPPHSRFGRKSTRDVPDVPAASALGEGRGDTWPVCGAPCPRQAHRRTHLDCTQSGTSD